MPSVAKRRDQSGVGLPEALVALAIGLLAVVAGSTAAAAIQSYRADAAARELTVWIRALRWKAIAEARYGGLWFERAGAGWRWWEVRDGNGNGLRTSEIQGGVDPIVGGPFRLGQRVEHTELGIPADPVLPPIPPRTTPLLPGSDPIRFGAADLISFSPTGRSSSGTLYLHDGRGEVRAVTLFGPTTRTRIWRFDRHDGAWRQDG